MMEYRACLPFSTREMHKFTSNVMISIDKAIQKLYVYIMYLYRYWGCEIWKQLVHTNLKIEFKCIAQLQIGLYKLGL